MGEMNGVNVSEMDMHYEKLSLKKAQRNHENCRSKGLTGKEKSSIASHAPGMIQ